MKLKDLVGKTFFFPVQIVGKYYMSYCYGISYNKEQGLVFIGRQILTGEDNLYLAFLEKDDFEYAMKYKRIEIAEKDFLAKIIEGCFVSEINYDAFEYVEEEWKSRT